MVNNSWKSVTLSQIGTFQKGAGISRAESNSGVLPAVRYGELYTVHNNYVRTYTSHISREVANKALRVHYGDVLFACSGETKEDIAKCAAIIDNSEVYAGGDIIVLSPSTEVDPIFLGFILNTPNVIQQRAQKAQGDAIVHISADSIKSIEITVPEYAEQVKIAKVLYDIDTLIVNLEKLIAKKKAIKQGAMQELLSGSRRLEGFSAAWKRHRIGDLGNFYSGLSGKSKADFGCGSARYITFMNVLANTIIDLRKLESVKVMECESQNAVEKGDLFFNTSSETPEEVGMCAVLTEHVENTYLNSFCFGFRIKNSEMYPLFLSYFFNSQEGRRIMSVLAQGATRYNLSKSYFSDIIITVPEKDEQIAITSILHDMEDEIERLHTKLAKYQYIKTGMMSELLTGRTRLV